MEEETVEKFSKETFKTQLDFLMCELTFTNCSDDFVTYEELQRAALKLGMSVPTREQIDAHMKFCHKIMPTKKQRQEGFENLSLDFETVKKNLDLFVETKTEAAKARQDETNAERPSKRPREETVKAFTIPPSLKTSIRKWHDVNKGQPDSLTTKLRQEEQDKFNSKRLKKEIINYTAQMDKPQADETPSVLPQLVQLQNDYIEILERRIKNLDDVLQRNLL